MQLFIVVLFFLLSSECDIWFLYIGVKSDISKTDITSMYTDTAIKGGMTIFFLNFASVLYACPLSNEQKLICGTSFG